MRILLAVTFVALCATPALAGNHKGNQGTLDKRIDNLNDRLGQTFVTPSPDRRDTIDALERNLARALYAVNPDNQH